MISYRPAVAADVTEILPNLRANDIEELLLSSGPEYDSSLVKSIELCQGDAEAAIDRDGNVIAILGCCVSSAEVGVPFMVCSDEVNKYPKNVIKDAKARTLRWSDKYPMLINMVYSGNVKTIKWLKHVGYTIGEIDEHWGYANAPFHAFYRIKEYV